ncbi:MAG: hypothetical protein LDL30_03435 [Desulfovibrio sp.]|nr:hypothetical protein [Desulfovibrio sp.]
MDAMTKRLLERTLRQNGFTRKQAEKAVALAHQVLMEKESTRQSAPHAQWNAG